MRSWHATDSSINCRWRRSAGADVQPGDETCVATGRGDPKVAHSRSEESTGWPLPWGAKGTVVLLAVAVRGEEDRPLATTRVLMDLERKDFKVHVVTTCGLSNKAEHCAPSEGQLVRARKAIRTGRIAEYRETASDRMLEDLETHMRGEKEVECPVCQGNADDCEFCQGIGVIVVEMDYEETKETE
jgi:hypothetical protein